MTKLLDDLAGVVRVVNLIREDLTRFNPAPLTYTETVLAIFVQNHAAEIEQNARDAEVLVWKCTRYYLSGDGGMTYSEKYAKSKADMLIYKAQGYECEPITDTAQQADR